MKVTCWSATKLACFESGTLATSRAASRSRNPHAGRPSPVGFGCSVIAMAGASKPGFSFGELLVLLDVDGVAAMSTPLPAPAEGAALTGVPLHGVEPCVASHGALRFRTGLAHLYEPPRTELVVSPTHVMLSIARFADEDIWTNMFGWVEGYLGDTLELTPSSAAREGYREYRGQGVIATLAYTRPNVRLDSRDLVIELALRRDEPLIATLHALFGLARETAIAPPDDGNWRELATRWPMHLECARHGTTVKFRFSAPHHDGQVSTANLCEEWSWRWLDLCAATGIGHHDHRQVSWDLPELGHASIVRGDGTGRRDVHELHVPARWLEP